MTFKKMNFDLSGKTAVVIGGTKGIGRGISITLADHGADVVPASRSIDSAKAVVDEIQALGRETLLTTVDCAQEAELEALKTKVLEKFGKVDILVNSQGVEIRGYIQEYALEDWRKVMSVNIDSVFSASKIFGREMAKRKCGKIINVASMASFFGLQEAPAYTASKGALNQFTKATALEFAKDNIQVNAIAPGWFRTDLTQPVQDNADLFKMIEDKIPYGKWGDVEYIGACAVYLASEAADYVTGATIPVDGGFLVNGA